MKQKIILIGNGMAGIRTLEEIIKKDPHKFEIAVFGEEPHPNYNRILLSSVLQGDASIESIVLNSYEWYAEHQIELFTGDPVVKVDTLPKGYKSKRHKPLVRSFNLCNGLKPFYASASRCG